MTLDSSMAKRKDVQTYAKAKITVKVVALTRQDRHSGKGLEWSSVSHLVRACFFSGDLQNMNYDLESYLLYTDTQLEEVYAEGKQGLSCLYPKHGDPNALLQISNNQDLFSHPRSKEWMHIDHASSSVEARDLNASPVATPAVSESRYPYTKKVKTTSATSYSTTPLATRAVSTAGSGPSATSSCVPHSICVDKISPCGKRYGGCYDENFCDGDTSPYPIPTCATMVTMKRAAAAAEPAITPA
ncbi:hypothetical protein M436DRAFT_67799 [Aureobasidium namibiae CBS 147.97]|uniref:Uncharacterized protein n=1 Tax=Aureobasidium namibiae CBS 147.97 TaxID=1043004 RepID=A0A074WBC8_9PEZI